MYNALLFCNLKKRRRLISSLFSLKLIPFKNDQSTLINFQKEMAIKYSFPL